MAACERIFDKPETRLNLSRGLVASLNSFSAVWEVIDHIQSRNEYLNYSRILADSLENELNVDIDILDSSYIDGDGIQLEIRFNNNSSTLDRKLRTGVILVSTDFNYREVGSLTNVEIKDDFVITSVNGNKMKINGSMNLNRTINGLKISSNDLEVDDDKFEADLEINLFCIWNRGETTPGLIGDIIRFTGDINFDIDHDDNAQLKIDVPLQKTIEYGCSDFFQSGQFTFKSNEEQFLLDYDEFNNQACNNIVRVIRGGKEFEVAIP
jgi:hypothetical protein